MDKRALKTGSERARPTDSQSVAVPNRSRLIHVYHRLPEKARIVVTGGLGLLFSLITYEIIYAVNPIQPRASTSWFLAFVIGVARQHALHRWLTFSHYSPYWPSLGRSYIMDTGSVFIGTGLNWLLTEAWGVNHRVAWLICLTTVAVINLLLLKRYVFRKGSKQPPSGLRRR